MKKNKMGFKNILIIILALLILGGGAFWYVNYKNKPTEKVSKSEKFKPLQNYLELQGYKCKNLTNSGSSCEKKTEFNEYIFYRYDDGFQYITNSVNYKVNITSRKDSQDISIQTLDGAIDGYQNKKYVCTTDSSTVLTTNIICKSDKEILDNEIYLAVVQNSLREVRLILDNSAFNANNVASDHVWER